MSELDDQMDSAIARDGARDFTGTGLNRSQHQYFLPPRWKGGPVICKKANLPAFKTEGECWDFVQGAKKGNPLYEGVKVKRVGKCLYCGYWHMETAPRDPAGSTSGTGRSQKES